jgi:hypothetical protein
VVVIVAALMPLTTPERVNADVVLVAVLPDVVPATGVAEAAAAVPE